jgi:hypothetical protein
MDNARLIRNGPTAILLCLFAVCGSVGICGEVDEADQFEIIEVLLRVTTIETPFTPALDQEIFNMAACRDFAVFGSNREVWIKQEGGPFRTIGEITRLPEEADWFGKTAAAGERVAVSVASYAEEDMIADSEAIRGMARGGPVQIGMLFVSGDSAEFVESFDVENPDFLDPDEVAYLRPLMGALPDSVMPIIQSFYWDGNRLFLGGLGCIAAVDVEKKSARILAIDYVLQMNRFAIFHSDGVLWVDEDEGGACGGSLWRHEGDRSQSFDLLGYNSAYVDPNSIVEHRGGILVSCNGGVVEIDRENRRHVQYRMSPDPRGLCVRELRVFEGDLWGCNDDGWIEFDLDHKSANLYVLEGDDPDNTVYDAEYFKGRWYVATKKGLMAAN